VTKLKNLGVALLSVVLALAICEVLLRVFGAEVLPKPDLYELDRDVGKRMRPGWEGDEFGAPVKVNSKGLRNPETPYEKPEGVYRVLALGDSWTFGFRMNEADAYPRQLERELNERAAERGDIRRFEVINAGVIGYSTDQEAAWLRVEGWKYQPDLVLVNYYPVNDTHGKLARYQRRAQVADLHPWLLAIRQAPKELYLRQFWKGVRRTVKEKLRVARAGGDPDAAAEDWTLDYREGHRGWQAVQQALADIGAQSREHHRPALLVLLPDALDLARYADRYHPKIEPMVRAAVAAAGIDFFDLEPTFAPWQGKEDEVRFGKLRHPNARGYGVIAEAVCDEIGRRYLGWDTPPKALVEMSGIEPPTSALRTQRSPS
jgi:lysophospholipase L1-like esterase